VRTNPNLNLNKLSLSLTQPWQRSIDIKHQVQKTRAHLLPLYVHPNYRFQHPPRRSSSPFLPPIGRRSAYHTHTTPCPALPDLTSHHHHNKPLMHACAKPRTSTQPQPITIDAQPLATSAIELHVTFSSSAPETDHTNLWLWLACMLACVQVRYPRLGGHMSGMVVLRRLGLGPCTSRSVLYSP